MFILKSKIKNGVQIIPFTIASLLMSIVIISCGGCAGVKNKEEQKISNNVVAPVQPFNNLSSNNIEQLQSNDSIQLVRNFVGESIQFKIDPSHKGGSSLNTVWSGKIENQKHTRFNRIIQLSPSVILYRKFPKELGKVFYHWDQPEKIEFLDDKNNTIKVIDIWNERPFQNINPTQLTYFHFDAEGMSVIPYKNQDASMKANEYSLFTEVRSEGNHVIVNYELRSLKTTKVLGAPKTSSIIIGVKHTLRIYDLLGTLKYELNDLPTVDGAVISPNGQFMMYTFGGEGMATADNPFGTMDRKGWALMRLSDQKVVYSEFTDDGKLASGKIMFSNNLPRISYSTPSTELDYDYWIFFDDKVNIIYKHNLTRKEREIMHHDFLESENSFSYRNYFNKFNFKQISIPNK